MEKTKMSLGKRITIGILVPIITFTVVLTVVLALGGNDSQAQAQQASSSNASATSVLYQDDVITVSYVEIFEEPSISGMCYVRLLVQNNSDQAITVYPKDASVNGTMTQFLSGVPMSIEVGKKSQQPFFFNYANAGIDKLSDVSNIEFKLWVVDKNTNTIGETGALSIDLG